MANPSCSMCQREYSTKTGPSCPNCVEPPAPPATQSFKRPKTAFRGSPTRPIVQKSETYPRIIFHRGGKRKLLTTRGRALRAAVAGDRDERTGTL